MAAQDAIGRVYPPLAPYEVGREKIAEFARALGDDNPAYFDRAAARALGHPDVIAPPTFAIVITGAAGGHLLDDPDLAIDFSHVVHGEQQFEYRRPIHAGDVLTTTMTVEDVRTAAGNYLITSRSDLHAADGQPVAAVRTMLVVRAPETGAPEAGVPGGAA